MAKGNQDSVNTSSIKPGGGGIYLSARVSNTADKKNLGPKKHLVFGIKTNIIITNHMKKSNGPSSGLSSTPSRASCCNLLTGVTAAPWVHMLVDLRSAL